MLKKIPTNLIVLFIVTIAFVSIIHFYSKDDKQQKSSVKNIERPDFYMNDIQTRSMDKSGKIRYTLTAEKVEHRPKDQRSFITKPDILTYKKNKKSWKALANMGEVPDNTNTILLKEDVIVNQNNSNTKHPISAKSDQLTYDIDQEKMITEGKVVITTPSSVIQGEKMIANIKTDTMEIFTNVNARHEPQNGHKPQNNKND